MMDAWMLGSVSHMGVNIDQRPYAHSTVGTAMLAVAGVVPSVAYTPIAFL
jgi:hypothetical protein